MTDIGHINQRGEILVQTINLVTEQIEPAYYSPDALCRMGYGDVHVNDICVQLVPQNEALPGFGAV